MYLVHKGLPVMIVNFVLFCNEPLSSQMHFDKTTQADKKTLFQRVPIEKFIIAHLHP